jgi:superfamily II DNA or RNA helicase/HKD family nuclease
MSTWRRAKPEVGIYDEIINAKLDRQLAELGPALEVVRREFGQTEDVNASLAMLLRDALDVALSDLQKDNARSLQLAEDLLAVLRSHVPKAFSLAEEMRLRPERLRAVLPRPGSEPKRPRGSLHTSSLIVNAEGEDLLDHLRSEFDSADRIDLLCAFVKLSGFEKFRPFMERHCVERGRTLRVLTTTYMAATDAKAIERLAALPNVEVKVSYDNQGTRLHAKAWVFHRHSGFSTAYVGSSNLSHSAQTEGLEWNVRMTESDQPALLYQMRETFEQYWNDEYQFERFDGRDEPQRRRLRRALSPEVREGDSGGFLADLEPKDFQKPILEELAEARRLGRHRNLLVAATGTGKTVMAALDYSSLREQGAVDSLLFVAHRREILEQSRRIFRSALQSQTFGEFLFHGVRPEIGRHLFASIDSLGEDSGIDVAGFDMVVLDEAHHTAADSWQALLDRVRPRELVGLTGTPERADGLDYERHFPRPWVGNLRLWNAIPHALVPFRYYMLDVEGVDLRDTAWVANRYASGELAGKLIGAAEIFVHRACRAIVHHIARPDELRAIAFCVDIRHAEEVCARLVANGYRAAVLTGQTPADTRRNARLELDSGSIQILCVVDIYNEGIDVPNVNTVFFFRPTESATVFLQQLGRGLRRSPGKSELVVFDLTCRQRMEFRFDRRLRALLGHTPRELHEAVSSGFGRLPAGCHLHFDEIARDEVLAQLRRAIPDNLRGIREILREPQHADLSLQEFLHETDVAIEDLYAKDRSWSLLRHDVALDHRPFAQGEKAALKKIHKLLHVGDEGRLGLWSKLVALGKATTEDERRLTRMLFAVLYGKDAEADGSADEFWPTHAILRGEIAELIPVLRARNAVLAESHRLRDEIPLQLHARYLGVELSAAINRRAKDGRLRGFPSGVERGLNGTVDILTVTVNKSRATKEHLRYRDFPLSSYEFNWQSKSRTTRDSLEGRRHLQPDVEGCMPLLFVRERDDDRPGVTMGYRYLGPVTPIGDEGERPITIRWKLKYAMPSDLLHSGRVAA